MRVTFFCRAFSPSVGGLERISEVLAREFSSYGHEVVVVTDTPTNNQSISSDSNFIILRTKSFWKRFSAFKESDVILFFNLSLVGLVPAILTRKKIIMSHHGIYVGKSFFSKRLEWFKRQLTIFFPNISVSHFVSKHIPGDSLVIGNAYDSALFTRNYATPKFRDFVFCGRLVPEKGVLLCLEAFNLTMNFFPNATFTIIGDGPELGAIKNFLINTNLTNNVFIKGALSGELLVNEIERHSCLIVPSIWQEPFGIVALEGIALCDTVIATRSGGLPEVLEGLGMLVNIDCQELSLAMIAVLNAKKNGDVLPGQPSEAVRLNFLSKHTSKFVAKHYLEFIERECFK